MGSETVPVFAQVDLAVAPGEFVAIVGESGVGKSTLLNCLAGLDAPSAGSVQVLGTDLSALPEGPQAHFRRRHLGFVFQAFHVLPHLSVAQNVALPLMLLGVPRAQQLQRVAEELAAVGLSDLGERLPQQLSGGQLQRVALARALAKAAPLMLLDEPLVNLDYKLREELREELTQLFAVSDATVVYATTEPGEALLLGGYTAVLDAGELLQYGPTAEVFHAPRNLRVARAFSDPPMNLIEAEAGAQGLVLQPSAGQVAPAPLALALPPGAQGRLTLGVRASNLHLTHRPGHLMLPGSVELAEISGSDTFVHVATPVGELVAQLTGVHRFALGERLDLSLDPGRVYAFDAAGALLLAPRRAGGRG